MNRLQAAAWILTAAATAALTGCAGNGRSATSPVVDTVTFKPAAADDRPAARVTWLDVRSEEAFLADRAAGATRVPIEDWRKTIADGTTPLEDREAWRSRLRELGLPAQGAVLVYDDGKMTEAARVWFLLQHFGVPNVTVVNGGWPVLKTELPEAGVAKGLLSCEDAGGETSTGAFAGGSGVGLETKETLRREVAHGTVRVLDARAAGEYDGSVAMNNKRTGRLPGAVNIPHDSLMANGRLKSPEELRAIFRAAGLKPGDRIVTHCQGGGRASLAALALVRAGYGNVDNYYMSFGEWAADESCPIEGPGSGPGGN